MVGSSPSKSKDGNGSKNSKARKSFSKPKTMQIQEVHTREVQVSKPQEQNPTRPHRSENYLDENCVTGLIRHGRSRRISSSSSEGNQGSRSSENEDMEIINAEELIPTPFQLLIPKQEREESTRSRRLIDSHLDPRMIDNPTEAPPLITDNIEKSENETELSSVIDVVKVEIQDLNIGDNLDADMQQIRQLISTPTVIEPVRIKTEPIDEDEINATSQPVEDDRCSVDSGSTVGLPSPRRSPSPSFPMPTEEDGSVQGSANLHSNAESLASSSVRGRNSDIEPAVPATSFYSAPMGLQEQFRMFTEAEAQKLALEAAKNSQPYSREDESSEETSSNEELQNITETSANDRFSDGDDDMGFGDDDDGELFDDDDREIESSWVNSESHVENVAGQKRPLPVEASGNHEGTPTKKSKFQVLKDPQFFSSTSSSVGPDEAVASTSTQSDTDVDKNKISTRPKIPVKLTTQNRASMLVTDYIISVNTPASQVQKKRSATPTNKLLNKVKKQTVKEKSTPSDAPVSDYAAADLDIPSAAYEDHPVSSQQQNPSRELAIIRDPRLRNKKGPLLGNQSAAVPPTSQLLEKMLHLSNKLKNGILSKVLKWQFNWIAEQVRINKPPPDLLKVNSDAKDKKNKKDENDDEDSDERCLPVLSEYPSMKAYLNIFHPLMLHEMWSKLCRQNRQDKFEKKNFNWDFLIKSSTEEEVFTIFNCFLLLELKESAPQANDLVAFTFTRPTGKLCYPFGFVESSKTTEVFKTADLDQRLLSKFKESSSKPSKAKPNFSAEVVIRMSNNYALNRKLNEIYPVSKIASLSTSMALFRAQGALDITPFREMIFKPRLSGFELMRCSRLPIDYLDPTQTDALYSIWQTMLHTYPSKEASKIALIQGFPGTGKTHVLVYIIGQLLGTKQSNIRQKILYCAPTNAAVDEMIRRLLSYNKNVRPEDQFNVLRIGSWERLHKEVRSVTLEEMMLKKSDGERVKQENQPSDHLVFLTTQRCKYENEINELSKERDSVETVPSTERLNQLEVEIDTLKEDLQAVNGMIKDTNELKEEEIAKTLQVFKHDLIFNSDVICTTLEACQNTDLEKMFIGEKSSRPFSCCIIDDASLCTEPETLFPLALGMNKLILAGDIELTPFALCSSVAKENKLDQSLFTRFHSAMSLELPNNPNNLLMHSLTTQHRMDEEISQWASKYYYGNKLLTSSPIPNRIRPLHPYRVLDVKDSQEMVDGSSFVNKAEAEVVVKIVESIVRAPEMEGRVIGVITFFENQRLYIRSKILERLGRRNSSKIDVKLIKDLQGTEMDIVVISCTKTKIASESKNLTELTDYWNVAITRAVESLYICGNLKALQKNEILNDLIRDAENRQVIRRVSSYFETSLLYDVLRKTELKSCN